MIISLDSKISLKLVCIFLAYCIVPVFGIACYTQQALTINANQIITSYSSLQNYHFNQSSIQCMNTTFMCPGVGSMADFCRANSQTTGPITLYSVMSTTSCSKLGSVNGTVGSVNCCVGSGLIGCNAPSGLDITNNLYYNSMQSLPQSKANAINNALHIMAICLFGLLVV